MSSASCYLASQIKLLIFLPNHYSIRKILEITLSSKKLSLTLSIFDITTDNFLSEIRKQKAKIDNPYTLQLKIAISKSHHLYT